MYKRLAKALYRTRDTLHCACIALDINPEDLQPELMLVVACDWCSIWERPISMIEQEDSTMYCTVCAEMHLYKYD